MLRTFEWLLILAGVALIVSLVGISYLSAPPSRHPSEQQTSAQSENKEQAKEQHSLRGFVRFLFPDGIAVFTFFLVLATIGLGWVAIVQIGFLERAENISSDASKAAKKSADVAKEALINTQRGFLFVKETRTDWQWEPQKDGRLVLRGVRMIPIWENSGVTPAKNVRAWNLRAMVVDPNTVDFEKDEKEDGPIVHIPAKGTFKGGGIDLSVAEVWALFRKEKRLFLWARTEYNDIFDGTPRHHTQYCVEAIVLNVPGEPVENMKLVEYSVYTKFNSTD